MKRALENANANPGFLRPDAKLGVIFLTDEDDCSAKSADLFSPDPTLGPLSSFRCTRFGVTCAVGGATPDQMNMVGEKINCTSNPTSALIDDTRSFATALKASKADPRNIFVAGIIGDPTPLVVEEANINGMTQARLAHVCTVTTPTGADLSDPGLRMKRFLDQFPDRSRFERICQRDLSSPLFNIGQLAATVVGNACITRALAMPLDCIVEDDTGTTKTPIPPCGSPETPPCWKLEINVQACPTAQNQRLVIVRAAAPPPSTITTMRCTVQ
ncbi:MAG: hypothetical protein H0T65_07125 [Deltaproteobacteria bacterium]|nr:hypothetical protein [Deltaproteobacteria bacterium]